MGKRDDLAAFKRHRARKWTRVTDYLPGPSEIVLLEAPRAERPATTPETISRRGLWLPVYALGIAAVALWGSGALDRDAGNASAAAVEPAPAAAALAPAAPSTSRGLLFGLCDQGGGTNCVVDGNSFYLAGTAIRVAGIDAPKTHAAACEAEALLGRAAAARLHGLLNSGELALAPAGADRDPNGRLLRQVRVDGRDVGRTLVSGGLAAEQGTARRWC